MAGAYLSTVRTNSPNGCDSPYTTGREPGRPSLSASIVASSRRTVDARPLTCALGPIGPAPGDVTNRLPGPV